MAKTYLENGEPFYWYEGTTFSEIIRNTQYDMYWCGFSGTNANEISEAWDNNSWQEAIINDAYLTGISKEDLIKYLHKYYDERIKYQKQYWIDKEEELLKNYDK